MSKIVKFFSYLFTALKEDGEDSPLSIRRIALGFILYFTYLSLGWGMQAAFMAGSAGAHWIVVSLMLAPFALCMVAIISIVIRLTATDIQQLVDSAKKG